MRIRNIIALLILGLLIYINVNTIGSAILHVYLKFDPLSPVLWRQLGHYYQMNAKLNQKIANEFYSKALQIAEQNLNQASLEQQALWRYTIGSLYECGQGVPRDLALAKKWYLDAYSINSSLKELLQASINRVESGGPC